MEDNQNFPFPQTEVFGHIVKIVGQSFVIDFVRSENLLPLPQLCDRPLPLQVHHPPETMTGYPTNVRMSSDAFAEKFVKGSTELMEQTTLLFKQVSFLNCTSSKTAGKDILVDQVIHVPSASATVQSDMTDPSASDPPQFACEGAIVEWLKELEARKAARQKAEAVRNLRKAAGQQHVAQSVRAATSDLRWDRPTFERSVEHEGILFTRSDTAVDELPPPVYSRSLF